MNGAGDPRVGVGRTRRQSADVSEEAKATGRAQTGIFMDSSLGVRDPTAPTPVAAPQRHGSFPPHTADTG